MRPRHLLVDRRDFLKKAGLGFAALPALDLVRFGPVSPATTRVAVVRTSDRAQGVSAALRLLDLGAVRGRRVVLKPNFNSADGGPASTHPDTLGRLVTELHERGARSILLGESSGPTNTRGVMEAKGVFDLAEELRFDVVDYDEIPDRDWIRFGPARTLWPDGFWLPRHVVDAEYVVSACCLKTHGFGGVFTMSLKLSVGLTPKPIRRDMHRSPDMRRMIADLNAAYRPDLVVLDGVEAFTDGGPSTGELKRGDVVIAGHDRIAVDAVGLAVLKDLGSNDAITGRKIFEQEQISRAVERGLGVSGPAEIDLVGPDPASRSYIDRLRPILAQG